MFEEAFAEVWLDGEWVKVEVITREGLSEGKYLVERCDRCGTPFEVEAQDLTSFGSHDPESKRQTWKLEEYEMMEKLLKEKDCTIEKID